MKTSMNETPIIEEIALLKNNSIQGLYSSKNTHESFWSLKAKIELSVFRQNTETEKQEHEKRNKKE
jgi:hypothetical protein